MPRLSLLELMIHRVDDFPVVSATMLRERAGALGITMPQALLLRADEVIR